MSTRPVRNANQRVLKRLPTRATLPPIGTEQETVNQSSVTAEKVEPEAATGLRENNDIKSLDDAKAETVQRGKYMDTLSTGDVDLQAIVSLKSQDIALKITMSADDWKPWLYEISNVLYDEKYPESATSLIKRCLRAITDEAEDEVFQLARNLLTSLNAFSAVNSQFKKAVTDSSLLKEVLLYLSRQEGFANPSVSLLGFIKSCLRLPLVLGYYSPPVWKTVEEKVVAKTSTIKVLPIYMEMKDEECRCLASLWFLRLSEYRSALAAYNSISDDNIQLLPKCLKIAVDNGDLAFVSWLINGIASFTKSVPENMAKMTSNPDFKKSLLQIVDCGTKYIGYVLKKAKQLLSEVAPDEKEKWKTMTFKANTELRTVEATRAENAVRIAFLRKVYDLAPDRLVCLDASNAINLLQSSKLLYQQSSEEWRTAYENVILQENFIELSLKYAKVLVKRDLDKEELAFEMTEDIYRMIGNLADCSEAARTKIAESGFVDFFLENLKDARQVAENCASSEHLDFVLLTSPLSILYNISKSYSLVHVFHALEAPTVLLPYINEKYRKVIQVSLFIAYIAKDTPEAARLAEEQGILQAITSLASKAIAQSSRTVKSGTGTWSLAELLDGLCLLAANDGNKMKLAMGCDILNLVNQLLVNGKPSEQIRCMDLLWTLCFETTIRNEITARYEDNIIKPLQNLMQSENKDVQKMAKKTSMFVDRSYASPLSQRPVKRRTTVDAGADGSHIFISYSWKQQEKAQLIRNELMNRNYKVWMDVDETHGGMLDSMAKAIEDAAVVLLCFSHDYKANNACRSEAEYAFSLNKKVVPVNMEYRYEADGWLGVLVRSLMYIDMSLAKTPFEIAIEEVFREIENAVGDLLSALQQTPAITASSAPPADSDTATKKPETAPTEVAKSRASKVGKPRPKYASWTTLDIANWLRREGLYNVFGTKLENFDGEKMWTLLRIKDQAMEFFYQTLKEHVGVSLPDLLDLIAAIDRLAEDDS